MSETKTPIRISIYSLKQVTIDGLVGNESELLKASILGGHHWIRRGSDGRLLHVASFDPLPGPITDEEMLPFWRRPSENEARQADLFGFDESTEAALKHASPSIYISSLCGYNYTAENYKREASKLSDWGFVCMRSPRDEDSGHFQEVWYLSGVWAAKGELEESIVQSNSKTQEAKFKHALEFIRFNVEFGSLDVSMQRMAMAIPD